MFGLFMLAFLKCESILAKSGKEKYSNTEDSMCEGFRKLGSISQKVINMTKCASPEEKQ